MRLTKIKTWIFFGLLWIVLLVVQNPFILVWAEEPSRDFSCWKDPLSLVQEVQPIKITDYYQAVGSIQPLQETMISSQIQARVQKVLVRPGDRVSPGQELLILDDREFKSRLGQIRQELQAAQAAKQRTAQEVEAARVRLQEAEPNYERVSKLQEQGMASQQMLDRARSAFLQAKAGLEQAQMALQEAKAREQGLQEKVFELQVLLDYTRIKSQDLAEVVQRMVEPGDVVIPGRALLRLQSRHNLCMEAQVPEGLLQNVLFGRDYTVHVDPLDQDFQARVREVEPAADPGSRSFLVKLDLQQASKQLYPGMFARLMLDFGEQELLVVPFFAVRHIGQLETVQVLKQGKVSTRHVRSGRRIGDCVEILSGLEPGEKILLQNNDRAKAGAEPGL